MKKIVKLTERDLTRLVRRVIKEQQMELQFPTPKQRKKPHHEESDRLMLNGDSAEEVSEKLSELSENIIFLAILDCEYADFSDIDMCSFPNLKFLNLKGTDNNFEEQGYECFFDMGNSMYSHERLNSNK